jgi:hypothetical protein
MLTSEQMATLAAHIRANTTAAIVEALAIRNDNFLTQAYNTLTATDAWVSSVSGAELFELTDVTKFDGLTAGKRDAWRLMLDFAPINATRNANRKAIVDVWGNTDSVAVLQGCRRKATLAELTLGGNSATTNTVSALKLNWEGQVGVIDVATALNQNP